MELIKQWASTVTAALCGALVIGGLNLHSDVKVLAHDVSAVTVLAQSVDTRETVVESNLSGVEENIKGLRRDIDKVGQQVEEGQKEAAKDRALILQELGKLQGSEDKRK